jgi:hypothetical protein
MFNREIQKAGPSRKRDLLGLNNLGTGNEDELLLQSHKTIVREGTDQSKASL